MDKSRRYANNHSTFLMCRRFGRFDFACSPKERISTAQLSLAVACLFGTSVLPNISCNCDYRESLQPYYQSDTVT